MKITQLLSKKALIFVCMTFAVSCSFLLLAASDNPDVFLNPVKGQVMGVRMAVGGDDNANQSQCAYYCDTFSNACSQAGFNYTPNGYSDGSNDYGNPTCCGDDSNENYIIRDCGGNAVSFCCPDHSKNVNNGECIVSCPASFVFSDLTIQNVAFYKSDGTTPLGASRTINEGEDIVYKVTVKNIGATASGSFQYTADLSSLSSQQSARIQSLNSGETYTLTFSSGSINTSGRQSVSINLDTNNEIMEQDENNNSYFRSDYIYVIVENPEKPDLMIQGVSYYQSDGVTSLGASRSVTEGEDIVYKVTIKNIGDAASGSFQYTADLSSLSSQQSFQGESLDAGESLTFSLSSGPLQTSATQSITIELDSYNRIVELNETNNSYYRSDYITVIEDTGPPVIGNSDLTIQNVAFYKTDGSTPLGASRTINEGEDIVYKVTIKNAGNAASGSFQYSADLSSLSSQESARMQSLNPSETYTLTFSSGPIYASSRQSINIDLDTQNEIAELNENNNSYYRSDYIYVVVENPEKPDLMIQGVSYYQSDGVTTLGASRTVTEGEDIVYKVTIKNIGTADSGSFQYTEKLSILGTTNTSQLQSLGVGESFTFSLSSGPLYTSGAQSITVNLDPENRIVELNENNNSYYRSDYITVIESENTLTSPDLTVYNVSYYQSDGVTGLGANRTVTEGEDIVYKVTIKNIGDAASDSFQYSEKLSNLGTTNASQIQSLDARESIILSLSSGPIYVSGRQSINIDLDTQNEIAELNENNNSYYRSDYIYVIEAEDTAPPITPPITPTPTPTVTLKQGDLFKIAGYNIVYYLGTDNKRHVFPVTNVDDYKESLIASWNINENDIKIVSQSIAESYALGGNIVLRPGTKLIKIASDNSVYVVGLKGALNKMTIDQRLDLYGINNLTGWEENDLIVTSPDAFFINYTGGSLLSNNTYPNGTLIKYAGSSKIYLIYDNYKHYLGPTGFSANNFSFGHIITAPTSVVYVNGIDINKEYKCLTDIAQLTACDFTLPITEPKLSLSANNPASATVAAGTTKQLFGNFVLNASGSGEDIKVTQFRFTHQASKAGIHSYITGITLYDGNTGLNTPKSGEQNTGSTSAISTITLTNPLIIPKGTVKTISIKGDISGSAENGTTHKFIINNNTGVLSFGNSSSDVVTETGSFPLNGTLVTVVSAGTLNLSNASTNPAMGTVIADTTQTIGKFNFKASHENVEIKKIYLSISGSSNAYQNIDWLQLYDGSTLLGSIMVTGNNAIITPSNLIISKDNTKILTLKALTHKVGINESGNSGDNFKVTVTDIDAKGVSTGSTNITVNGLNATKTNAQYIYKSIPTITKISLSGMANGTQDLYKFTAIADSKGDVGLYKFTFSIDKDSVDVYNLELYEIVGGMETILTSNPVSISNDLVEMYIRDNEYVIIPAGAIKTFVLRGDVTGWDSNATLQTKMLGDSGNVLTPDTASVIDNNSNNNFIWSDLFLGNNAPEATTLKEWTNGALVFPTPSTQSLFQAPTPVAPAPLATPAPLTVTAPQSSMQQTPSPVAQNTAGFLLLHVEQGGAISYVDTEENNRYIVTWSTAMTIFESFAIGITDEDLLNIPVNTDSINPSLDTDGDGFTDVSELIYGYSPYIPGAYQGEFSTDPNFANSLRGEFLLQVEQGGAIWYVDQDGIRHNVRWANLMSIFQSLALGISNEDLGQIQQGN